MFVVFFLFQVLKLLTWPLSEDVQSILAQIAMVDYMELFVAISMAIGWSFGLIWTSYNQLEFLLLSAKQVAEQQARSDILIILINEEHFFNTRMPFMTRHGKVGSYLFFLDRY
jgi:hypothetical protein